VAARFLTRCVVFSFKRIRGPFQALRANLTANQLPDNPHGVTNPSSGRFMLARLPPLYDRGIDAQA